MLFSFEHKLHNKYWRNTAISCDIKMNECYTSDDEDADLLNPSFVSGNSCPDRGTKTDRIIKTLLINISFVAMVGLVIEQYEKILSNDFDVDT